MFNFIKLLIIFLCLINNAYAVDYSDALSHAKEAFLIQSGIQDTIQKTGQYFVAQVKEAGLEKESGTAIFAYKMYRDRTLTFPISHKTKVTLNLNSITFTFAL